MTHTGNGVKCVTHNTGKQGSKRVSELPNQHKTLENFSFTPKFYRICHSNSIYFVIPHLENVKVIHPPLQRCCHSGIEFFTDKTIPNLKAHGKVNGAD